eukprot:TRINITY_DN8008_c2_g1_i2.p1 TRINITY_DN8008_c2_g1~~TRINITY_DN8008_c2_g1_i2.p1  ORF type:complete len:238 (-),score=22.47 TRINITY_DN8008_c2_g1_i2:156-869(-)
MSTNMASIQTKRRFNCQFCDYSTDTKSHFDGHERRHTGEKPFICKLCNKSFAVRGDLIGHERTHTGEKPFKCKYCEKSFADRKTRTNHERTHTGEKPFSCRLCHKSFAQRYNFMRHERMHDGVKSFKCKHCDKTFARKDGLEEHERTHTDKKPVSIKKMAIELLHPEICIKEEILDVQENSNIPENNEMTASDNIGEDPLKLETQENIKNSSDCAEYVKLEIKEEVTMEDEDPLYCE